MQVLPVLDTEICMNIVQLQVGKTKRLLLKAEEELYHVQLFSVTTK